MEIKSGQNISITRLSPSSQQVTVSLQWQAQNGSAALDASAFLLTSNGRVRGDKDFVFYNNPESPGGAVFHDPEGRAFTVDLDLIPTQIEKVAVSLTIDRGQRGEGSFANLSNLVAELRDATSKALIATYPIDTRTMNETALVICEIYRRNDEWKFRALGQAFVGGLEPLAQSFGVEVASAAPPSATSEPSPPPEKRRSSVPKTRPKPVSLPKITLEKKGETVSLDKAGAEFGKIVVNLNWSRAKQKNRGLLGGLFGGSDRDVDLDLGCLFQTSSGQAWGVQALGNAFGNFDQPPYIQLMGDDRTGESAEGEFLHINGRHFDFFKRILIFTFIYEGVPNWTNADAYVTITVPGQPVLEVRLDSHREDLPMCAIAMIENDRGNIQVTKLVEYFAAHEPMDRNYHFGLKYVPGQKD